MCGICGFIGEVDDSKKVLKQMMDKIAHRGPDDEGMYVDNDVAIGHRRLSIIDLSHGAQLCIMKQAILQLYLTVKYIIT